MAARCMICNKTDQWENVDQYRIKPNGMSICKHCGFVTYPETIEKKEDLLKFYEKDYRKAPTIHNFYTGQTKLQFHGSFLNDWIKDHKDKEVSICDVGAAYGVFLDFMRMNLPKAKVYGTELTLSFRRNAWHEFGLNLTKEFDDSVKYDLICSYKVAEHQIDFDKELSRYIAALKPGGSIYISVPVWFEAMANPGDASFDLEYYYAKEHINAWTKGHFEYLLRRSGLKIVKEDHVMYGSTYLCKVNDKATDEEPFIEDSTVIKDKMQKIKAAFELYNQGMYTDAVKTYPNYPIAYMALYEFTRKQLHEAGIKHLIGFLHAAIKNCPSSVEVIILASDIMRRYEKYDEAIGYISEGLKLKPSNIQLIKLLSEVLRSQSLKEQSLDKKKELLTKARDCLRFARNISLQNHAEIISWIYHDNAQLPMPNEKE